METKIEPRETKLTMESSALSLLVETQGVKTLFLVVPVGDDSGSLMTAAQFDGRWSFSIQPADRDPASDPNQDDPEAEPQKPDAELRPARTRQNNIGQLPISRLNEDEPATFKILIQKFAPPKACDAITLELRDSNRKPLAATKVVIAGAAPKIEKFVSNRYNFRSGAVNATLSWEIKPAGRYQLLRVLGENTKETTDSGNAAKGEKNVKRDGNYQLEALGADGKPVDTRGLSISSFDETRFVNTELGPDGQIAEKMACGEILGIYPCGGKLFGVVRNPDNPNLASIWYSDGRYSREYWSPVVNPQGQPVVFSAQAASRPGVVFDNRLYFIGGSSYDANLPGSEVGYFHFEAATWVPQDLELAWPQPRDDDQDDPDKFPKPRMGHAVLAHGRQVWLIGGYNGDGGAMNDIWVYDKDAGDEPQWQRRRDLDPDWEPRCLFGAAFCGSTLWIAGGFEYPGGATYDHLWYCDTANDKRWIRFDTPLVKDPDPQKKQYRGCALAAIGSDLYAFASYRELGNPNGLNTVLRIYPDGDAWGHEEIMGLRSDWVATSGTVPLDWYRFDATAFDGRIFVRRLARAAKKDTLLHYLALL